MKEKIETTVVFGDVHGIYYDPRTWKILLDIIKDLKPQRVVINGDFMDCYSISSFDKDPGRDITLHQEFEQANGLLDELQHIFKGEIIFVFGNHENRLKRKLWGDSPEFDGLPGMSIEGYLNLEERGIEYIKPRGKDAYYKLGSIKIGHFNKVSQHSAYTAKSLVDKYACTVIQAHTHRLGSYFKTYGADEMVAGFESGCVCSLNPDYVSDPNWQSGLIVINKLLGIDRYSIQTVPIIHHETLFNGKVYRA